MTTWRILLIGWSLLIVSPIVATGQTVMSSAAFDASLSSLVDRARKDPRMSVDDASPTLEQLGRMTYEDTTIALAQLLRFASDPVVLVRRFVGIGLYQTAKRPDSKDLLVAATPVIANLLVDADVPTRRITVLAIYSIRPSVSSPLTSVLINFLDRPDAVATIGAAVAGLLMEDSSDEPFVTTALSKYMERHDQTSASRDQLLQDLTISKRHDTALGHEAALYLNDPSDQTSVLAAGTLRSMGRDVISENSQKLASVANDPARNETLRSAARQALADSIP